jgi:hypothetical protein
LYGYACALHRQFGVQEPAHTFSWVGQYLRLLDYRWSFASAVGLLALAGVATEFYVVMEPCFVISGGGSHSRA